MRQSFQNRLNMWRAVLKYLADRLDVWKGNPAFVRAVKELQQAVQDAMTAEQGQALSPEGATQDKYAIELQAINELLPILKNTKAYALEMEDHTLYRQVNYNRASLLALTDSASLATMRELVDVIKPHVEKLRAEYGLDGDALEKAQQRINNYEKAMDDPRALVVDRSVATQSLPGVMKDGTRPLKRMDNLVHNFDKTSPGFSAGYKAARIVKDLGGGHEDGPTPPAEE